jgi:hypothetical protein
MNGWLEWFEERCAILEFDAGMETIAAEAHMGAVARQMLAKVDETEAHDLTHSRFAYMFYNPQTMIRRKTRDVEVVEYRWMHHDGHDRITPYWHSEKEAHATFGDRWHEKVEETRRVGTRAVY